MDEGSIRVLLVEDSEDDALLLLRELRRGGYDPVSERVYTAEDMESALDEGEWDLVISDHSMPSFSSSAALDLLHRKGYGDLPFIIVSGKIGEDAAVAAMRAGAHDYVMKDNLARLNTAIERELREAKVRRERRWAETRFRLMFEQSPLSTQILAPDGGTLRANRAWEKLWGVTLDQIRDYNILRDTQLIEKGVMPYIEEGFAGRSAAIPAIRYEPDVSISDVSDVPYRWVRAFIYPVKDEAGNVQEVVLVHEDITERREAEEKYRSIFENSVEGIFQSTVEGRLLTANPAMARMLGYESADELLASVSDIGRQLYVDPGQREEFKRRMEREGSVSGFEIEVLRKDGGTVLVSVAGRLVRGADGEPVGYEGTLEDITARKRAEESLRQSEERYRAVVEQTAEGLFLFDAETKRILETNPAFQELLGYTAEELQGMSLYDLVADGAEGVDWNARRTIERGHVLVGERRYLRKDGTEVDVEVSGSVISYGGRQIISALARDVTERKRAQERLREIREAERRRISRDLHDGVLQDLSYTLQSMQIQRRLSGKANEEQDRQVEALKRAVDGLRDAIYDLRLEAARERPLVDTLGSLVELHRRMNPDRQIELVVGEGFPESLAGRAGIEVARIVQEALVNVRRHSEARRVTVTLDVVENEALAEVEDNGRGFEQAASSPGIGLMSMRERALALEGKLEVESRKNVGTRVRLRVPLPRLLREAPERSA